MGMSCLQRMIISDLFFAYGILFLCEQMADLSKTRADEKQVEAEILGRSVEELENTVYALESQVCEDATPHD